MRGSKHSHHLVSLLKLDWIGGKIQELENPNSSPMLGVRIQPPDITTNLPLMPESSQEIRIGSQSWEQTGFCHIDTGVYTKYPFFSCLI